MVVNFEFLGDEPIENYITCMNFKIDKVVFFGYEELINNKKVMTEEYLKDYCDVQIVEFCVLPKINLQVIINIMRKAVRNECRQDNSIYFDITGGESLILVAFGILSKEFETPIHLYDVESDKIIELDDGAKTCISKDVEVRKVKRTLDLMIKMHGGKINNQLRKGIKDISNGELIEDFEKIYQVARQYWDYWNPFSNLLRAVMIPDENLQVKQSTSIVLNALLESNTKLKTPKKLNEILDKLADIGVLLNVKHANGYYSFKFKNQNIKDCLWEAGSILELHTCRVEAKNSDECQAGVYIDWDGVIHEQPGIDVVNEVDVLSLEGNVLTFISCKSGKMGGQQVLHALYELETVTRRFGGKYAKKVLVTAKEIGDVYMERAKEMGIEVR